MAKRPICPPHATESACAGRADAATSKPSHRALGTIRSRTPQATTIPPMLVAFFWLHDPARQRRRSRALATTLTLENAMAAPASIGVKKPNAASGIPTTL